MYRPLLPTSVNGGSGEPLLSASCRNAQLQPSQLTASKDVQLVDTQQYGVQQQALASVPFLTPLPLKHASNSEGLQKDGLSSGDFNH